MAEHSLDAILSNLNDVIGVGIDIEEIARFRSTVPPAAFTEWERAMAAQAPDPSEYLAGRWCAKEATVKAASSMQPLALRDIEIRSSDTGRPEVHLLTGPTTAEPHIEVSIAHTQTTAIAIAVLRERRSA